MKTAVTHSSDTKQKVLEAACKVFSEVGYHEGTVAKICEEAGANKAAVNYYYGDKENLYREVWTQSLRLALEAYPLEPPEEGLQPTERLRHFMRSLVLRTFDSGPAGCFTRIMAFEIRDPQGFLNDERAELRQRHDRCFAAIVRELLGDGARMEDLMLCRFMVLVPSLGMGMLRFGCYAKQVPHEMFEFDPEEMAERMFRFALAGIEDLRSSIRRRDAAGEGGA
jgi:AcrR family transcriptional regulator